ncbi:laminin-1 binding [Mactra antiquata]
MIYKLTTLYVILHSLSPCDTATLYDHSSATPLVLLDDLTHPITVSQPIIIHGGGYSTFYVSDNGMITFDNSFLGTSWPLNVPWIAPFGADITAGDLKSQTINDPTSQVIITTNSLVNDVYPDDSFLATEITVVSWLDVQRFSLSGGSEVNSFQLVLATDTTKSYAIFLYENIEWYPPDVIGISSGDPGHNYMLCNTDKSGMLLLPYQSNFQCSASPGVIVLRIDTPSWTQVFPCINLYTPIECLPSSGVRDRCTVRR